MRTPLTIPGPATLPYLCVLAVFLLTGCTGSSGDGPAGDRADGPEPGERSTPLVFTGARLVDGTGGPPLEDGTLVVREGRIETVGPTSRVEVPEAARTFDLSGRTLIPGLVNAHGHVGTARGLRTGSEVYTRDNILDQLALQARYGVTTVLSLGGGGGEGVRVREEQANPGLERSRLFLAGPVLAPESPGEVPAAVEELARMDVDWAKIRVDDFLGRAEKMSPDVYGAVIEEAHAGGLPVAVHIVELADAKRVVRAGADLLAHSVRDAPVDDELIRLLIGDEVCLSPTLTREVSTFVYAERPDFFDDPFFRREADPAVLEELLRKERQERVGESEAARYYEGALPLARENLAALHEAGVGIAFGTDAGPPARFQGYFEHMEMELMVEAGMEPAEVLRAATGGAARCIGLDDRIGTLEPGKWADFVVLRKNPLEDIRNVRAIQEVRIAGNRVPGSRWSPSETGEEER